MKHWSQQVLLNNIRSYDADDWSNENWWKFSFAITGINHILISTNIENSYFKLMYYFTILLHFWSNICSFGEQETFTQVLNGSVYISIHAFSLNKEEKKNRGNCLVCIRCHESVGLQCTACYITLQTPKDSCAVNANKLLFLLVWNSAGSEQGPQASSHAT